RRRVLLQDPRRGEGLGPPLRGPVGGAEERPPGLAPARRHAERSRDRRGEVPPLPADRPTRQPLPDLPGHALRLRRPRRPRTLRKEGRLVTRTVYILGGAGTGESTFTAELLEPWDLGPLEIFHEEPLVRGKGRPAMIKVRGHLGETPDGIGGLYPGQMRPEIPGPDSLDRVCGPAVNAWLRGGNLPDFIIAEGALLANPRQLPVFAEETDLLVLHFTVDEMIADLRFLARGSNQAPTYV